LAEKPDITLRALVAELADRGVKVSCFAVWPFFEHEGISFKKACTPANRIVRTWPGGAPSGGCIKAGLMLPAWCSSRDLGQDQHDAV
jgi:hypothetical protein